MSMGLLAIANSANPVITKHVDNNFFLCDLHVPSLGMVHQQRVLMLPGVEQDVMAWSPRTPSLTGCFFVPS
jgi:hypothetical protein